MVNTIDAFTLPHGPAGSLVVYVMVTEPPAMSAADAVYIAAVVLLLNVPVPLVLQVADVAPPPIDPAIVAVLPAQIVWLPPALTVATGFMVNTIDAFTLPHGPAGSLVVYVMVTEPAAMSATVGVYIAVVVLLLNVPVPLVLQVADVAPPPNEPAIVAVLPAQMV